MSALEGCPSPGSPRLFEALRYRSRLAETATLGDVTHRRPSRRDTGTRQRVHGRIFNSYRHDRSGQYDFTWRARSSRIDETNHIYYPELFRLLDDGIDALLKELGHSLLRLILEEDRALPIVYVEADYRSPIGFGDEVRCEINLEPGDSPVRFRGSGTVEGESVFDATIVRVFVDTESFEKRPLPDDLRSGLERI